MRNNEIVVDAEVNKTVTRQPNIQVDFDNLLFEQGIDLESSFHDVVEEEGGFFV